MYNTSVPWALEDSQVCLRHVACYLCCCSSLGHSLGIAIWARSSMSNALYNTSKVYMVMLDAQCYAVGFRASCCCCQQQWCGTPLSGLHWCRAHRPHGAAPYGHAINGIMCHRLLSNMLVVLHVVQPSCIRLCAHVAARGAAANSKRDHQQQLRCTEYTRCAAASGRHT